MEEIFSRSAALLGADGLQKLHSARVAVFGLGGVGGYACEALARSGVGNLVLVDGDSFSRTNINRQIYALNSTLGKNKAEVAAQRVADINPDIKTEVKSVFFNAETLPQFDFASYDYVIDAIDNVTSKILLAQTCAKLGVQIISCMGTGNKLDPTSFKVCDISKTSVCPLARVMRRELKKRGVERLNVIYSEELPKCKGADNGEVTNLGAQVPSSVAFVPPVAGFIAASEAVKHIVSCE